METLPSKTPTSPAILVYLHPYWVEHTIIKWAELSMSQQPQQPATLTELPSCPTLPRWVEEWESGEGPFTTEETLLSQTPTSPGILLSVVWVELSSLNLQLATSTALPS
jgi:hypothetical protein